MTPRNQFDVDEFMKELEGCIDYFASRDEPAEPSRFITDAENYVRTHPKQFSGLSQEQAIARAMFYQATGVIQFEE
jgi:hypothetical protein